MTSQSLNTSAKPTFKGFSEATGHTSLLSDSSEEKLNTFGWKVTTNEESYSSDTLIGNWNEEKFDIKSMSRSKPLPSQVSKDDLIKYNSGQELLVTKVLCRLINIRSG